MTLHSQNPDPNPNRPDPGPDRPDTDIPGQAPHPMRDPVPGQPTDPTIPPIRDPNTGPGHEQLAARGCAR